MRSQIAVRLPVDLVAFLDTQVGDGRARSRADVVTRALERERRRVLAERDAAILSESGDDADLVALAEHTASVDA